MRFLLWNVNRNNPVRVLSRLAAHGEFDVLVLLELDTDAATLIRSIESVSGVRYVFAEGECKTVKMFAREGIDTVPLSEGERYTIRRVRLSTGVEFLLAGVHLPSKLHWSDASQGLELVAFSDAIRRTELGVGHRRTILVGDLNMDPFEGAIVGGKGLHAVSSRTIASEGERVVQGIAYPYFYNPMWSLFGDGTPGPPGTYFYRSAEHVSYFWHMFDQVLLRPDLLPYFKDRGVTIVDTDGVNSFVDDAGRPGSELGSDHFPVTLELSFPTLEA